MAVNTSKRQENHYLILASSSWMLNKAEYSQKMTAYQDNNENQSA